MNNYYFVVSSFQDAAAELYSIIAGENEGAAVETLRASIQELIGDGIGIEIPTEDEHVKLLSIGIDVERIDADDIFNAEQDESWIWDGEEVRHATHLDDPISDSEEIEDDENEKFVATVRKRQERWVKTEQGSKLSFKVADKGGVSVYGLNRFPVTLYYGQWVKLLGVAQQLSTFLEENKSILKTRK